MIKSVSIKNFKCFAYETAIELSNLTACVGMNSVGKSSLIQSLLLLRKSYEAMEKYKSEMGDIFKISLNDDYALHLGSTDEIISSKDTDIISISANCLKFQYKAMEDRLSLSFNKPTIEKDILDHTALFSSHFYYLNAERLGPRNYQQIESTEYLHCGFHGEHTFDVVNRKQVDPVDKNRRFPNDATKTVPTLGKQVEYWLNYIVNGVEATFTSDLSTQLAQMKIQQSVFDTGFISPYNFGFGISYLLPIIVTGLIAEPHTVIIVENPEAHLHPAGQSRIGQFLSQVANAGIQIIIETHSEHVINGIRIHALKNNIAPETVCINYFSINAQEQKHSVKRITLSEKMEILEWPDGFFDQEEKDLKELRMIRREKRESRGVVD